MLQCVHPDHRIVVKHDWYVPTSQSTGPSKIVDALCWKEAAKHLTHVTAALMKSIVATLTKVSGAVVTIP